MNKVIAQNIMGFMSRVQLQGVEVPAYHEAMCALHEIAAGNETKPTNCVGERVVKVDGIDAPLYEVGT